MLQLWLPMTWAAPGPGAHMRIELSQWHMMWFLLPLTLFRLLVSQNRLSRGLSAEVSSYSLHFGDRALWAFCPVSPWEMWVRILSCSFLSSWHPMLSSLLLVCWAWPGEFQVLPALGGRLLPCARFHGWVKWKWDALPGLYEPVVHLWGDDKLKKIINQRRHNSDHKL